MRLSGGAAPHGEILAGKMHLAAFDLRASRDHAIGGHLFAGHPKIGRAMKSKQSDLLKAVWVNQSCNAFPCRQLAGCVLFLNALLAAAEFKLRAFCLKAGYLFGHCLLTFFLLSHLCS